MNLVIRAATLADTAACAGIHARCFDEPWGEDSFRGFLQQDSTFAFLCHNADASHSQAFILVRAAASESEILTIGTLPRARRIGLAAALLKKAASEAARRHATVMFLEVAEDNIAALALYAAHGFALAGRRQAYYVRAGGFPVDATLLRAALPLQGHGHEARSRLD